MTTAIRKAALEAIDPKALEEPAITALLAHERRMATDPEIRAERSAAHAEASSEMRNNVIYGIAFACAVAVFWDVIGAVNWVAGHQLPWVFMGTPLCAAIAALAAIVDVRGGLWFTALRNIILVGVVSVLVLFLSVMLACLSSGLAI